jgi:hypothetical protein
VEIGQDGLVDGALLCGAELGDLGVLVEVEDTELEDQFVREGLAVLVEVAVQDLMVADLD